MIPLFKVFALMTRVFTRPLLMYIKNYQKNSRDLVNSAMARPFIALGNWQYHASMIINRKLFRVETDSDMFVQPLNSEIALEQGLELFYEIAVYGLILGISIYEMRKYAIEGQISKAKDKTHVDHIEYKLDSLRSWQDGQEAKLKEISDQLENSNRMALLGTSLATEIFWKRQKTPGTSS